MKQIERLCELPEDTSILANRDVQDLDPALRAELAQTVDRLIGNGNILDGDHPAEPVRLSNGYRVNVERRGKITKAWMNSAQ